MSADTHLELLTTVPSRVKIRQDGGLLIVVLKIPVKRQELLVFL